MIIDFHTHTFPDKIAEKTISYLAKKGNIKPYREGTLSSLKESMKKAGVDCSVVLPVATAARQVESINELSYALNGKDGVIYFGAIHPECENIEEILDDIKAHGIKGIKLHPDYQGAYFDDERYIRIMAEASKRDLITVTHAGFDVGYPDDIHCTPDRILRVLDALKGVIDNKLVLAHLGSCDAPDEVIEKLAKKPVYMDTAAVLDRYPEKAVEVIKAHGFDKILFATDSPWADQKDFINMINSFGFTDEEREKIFCANAFKLLGL